MERRSVIKALVAAFPFLAFGRVKNAVADRAEIFLPKGTLLYASNGELIASVKVDLPHQFMFDRCSFEFTEKYSPGFNTAVSDEFISAIRRAQTKHVSRET